MYTLIATLIIPNGTDPKPIAHLLYPEGESERIVLSDHDWGYDWDTVSGRAPASLYRVLVKKGIEKIHGDREVYISPNFVGPLNRHEKGRLTVWEIDYEI